jgi:hypothetical protein
MLRPAIMLESIAASFAHNAGRIPTNGGVWLKILRSENIGGALHGLMAYSTG